MFKKILAVMCSLLLMTSAVFASEEPQNLLADAPNLKWEGDPLFYDEYSNALYFAKSENSDNNKQSAVLAFELDESQTGFSFIVDSGNGGGSSDSGFCIVTFYDGEHKSISGLSTGVIKNLDNYTRFSIGTETNFFPIPKNAKTLEVALNAEQQGDDEAVHIYFRNLSLCFSGEKPLMLEKDTLYMDSKTGLSKVEIGVTPFDRYLWIGIVFVVALVFFIMAKWRDRIKNSHK